MARKQSVIMTPTERKIATSNAREEANKLKELIGQLMLRRDSMAKEFKELVREISGNQRLLVKMEKNLQNLEQ